jgi:hypothetical protein
MVQILVLLTFVFPVLAQSGASDGKNATKAEASAKATKPDKSDKADKSESSEITENVLSSLDYPELQVVPRASERLQMEAQTEASRGWLTFWPQNLSALMTLGTGFSLSGDYKEADASDSEKKDLDFRTQLATGIGVGWLALSTYYSFTKPYASEVKKVRAIPGRDKRSDLLRERLAEEALESPARLVRIFTWMSILTNFAANAVLLDQSTPNNNIYPVLGMLGSMLPVIFNNRYIENYERHLEYKRKIYAPVAFVGFRNYDERYARYEPQMVLQWGF